eukprot:scaffold2153_cov271-Chaetoceros_neogracile.AAC.12
MVSQPQHKKATNSEDFISSNFCFSCDDFDLSTIFSCTTITEETEPCTNRQDVDWQPIPSASTNYSHSNETRHTKNPHYPDHYHDQHHFQVPRRTRSTGAADHPPPVIALSRSSFSTVSVDSAESALENTEVDRIKNTNRFRKYRRVLSSKYPCKQGHQGSRSEDGRRNTTRENSSPAEQSSQDEGVDFLARHELLINALFDDAKHRNELIEAAETSGTPPRPTRKSSNADTVESRSSRISHQSSRRSHSSIGSDILSPSSHQFKKSLKMKRKCKHHTMSALKQYQLKSRRKHLPSGCSTAERTESSSCTSLTTFSNGNSQGDLAKSFLHATCQLQKDSGKGLNPGAAISASGRESAMAKLIEKMDLLAEVEQEGTFANSVLTRVQAKNMSQLRLDMNFGFDPLNEHGLVETRSMLAVKLGFMSLRYGIMVHWNKITGLAELIILRKMCPDSFMRVKAKQKEKTWRRRMKKMTTNATMDGSTGFPTPSMISEKSSDSDSWLGSELERVETAPN